MAFLRPNWLVWRIWLTMTVIGVIGGVIVGGWVERALTVIALGVLWWNAWSVGTFFAWEDASQEACHVCGGYPMYEEVG